MLEATITIEIVGEDEIERVFAAIEKLLYGAGQIGTLSLCRDAGSSPADRARLLHWQKCYGDLWELKLSFEKQHNRLTHSLVRAM